MSEIPAALPNPTEPKDSMLDDRHLRRFGYLVIIAVFFGLGTWSATAPISSAAHAPAKLRVESRRQTIQHLEGGIVKELHVRDGDFVEKGQVLIALDDTQARAQLEVVQGQYYLALAREARLQAQRDQLDAVVFPQELLDVAEDSRAREAMSTQKQIFSVRKAAAENELALYQQQAEQLESQLVGLESQRRASRRLVDSYAEELRGIKSLEKNGYTEKRKVRELDRLVAENEGTLGDLTAQIASTRSQVVESQLKALQLQKELQRDVANELDDVQERMFQLIEQRQALQDTLSRTVIRAPQAGRVLELSVHTVGAVIGAGDKLMDIVPKGERLVVEAKISPMDIDRVSVGQEADVRFSAFNRAIAPRVKGRLINLSADAITDPKDPNQVPYYQAVIEISDEGMKELAGNNLTLVAGMPVEVFVNTGERTLLEYLSTPLTNILARSFIED